MATCFQSYGRDASGSRQYQPSDTVAAACEAGDDAGDCIYGAARDYGNNYAGGAEASRFCAAAPARFAPRCFEGIGTILGAMHRYGAERRAACNGRRRPLPSRLLPRRSDHLVLGGLAARASLWNRRRKLALLMETMRPRPETRVVDVGVGDTGFDTEPGVASSHNFFEALYPWPNGSPPSATCRCRTSRASSRWCSCVTASGTELPFEDDAFDLAFSNAVVEHVGGRDRAAAVRRRALPGGTTRVRLDPEPLVPGRDAHAAAVYPLVATPRCRPCVRDAPPGQMEASRLAEQA